MLNSWNIRAPDKSKPTLPKRWRSKDGEDKGSRTYQMIIRKLQLLPVEDISISTLISTLPTTTTATTSKRKAINDSPPMKKAHLEESESDSEIYDMLQCKN